MDDQQGHRAGYCSGFARLPQHSAGKCCAAHDARRAVRIASLALPTVLNENAARSALARDAARLRTSTYPAAHSLARASFSTSGNRYKARITRARCLRLATWITKCIVA